MKFHTFQLFLMLSTKFWLIHCDIQPRTAKGKRFLRSPDPEFLCLPSCKIKPQTPSPAYLEHTHILRTMKGLTPPLPQIVAHSRQPEQIPQFSILESHTVAPGHTWGVSQFSAFQIMLLWYLWESSQGSLYTEPKELNGSEMPLTFVLYIGSNVKNNFCC